MQEIIRQPAPPKRAHKSRLTPKLKNLPIDPSTGIKLDRATANCLRSYAQYHDWKIIQQKDGDNTIIWRVG